MKKVEIMFAKQKELQKKLGYDLDDMNEAERTNYIKENFWYIITEFDEAFRELPYGKPWKKYDSFDRVAHKENLKEELIDAIHFFINVLLAAELSPEEIFEIYCKKNNVNFKRQEENYGQDEK